MDLSLMLFYIQVRFIQNHQNFKPVERALLDTLKQCVPNFAPGAVFFLIQLTLPPGIASANYLD